MNNYNAVKEVMVALHSTAIFRLKQTWQNVSSRYMERYHELHRNVSGEMSYSRLRSLHRDMRPPCIPFYGLHLTDLTFISDGNSEFLRGGFCINFYKCRKLGEVMRELEPSSSERYSFESLPHVQRFLATAPAWDEEQCYQQSLRLEEWKGPPK